MNDVAYARRQANRLFVALVADAVTFALFMALVGSASIGAERNPLIAATYGFAGTPGVLALKFAAGFVIIALAKLAKGFGRLWWAFVIASSLAIAGTMVGAGFNIAALLGSQR